MKRYYIITIIASLGVCFYLYQKPGKQNSESQIEKAIIKPSHTSKAAKIKSRRPSFASERRHTTQRQGENYQKWAAILSDEKESREARRAAMWKLMSQAENKVVYDLFLAVLKQTDDSFIKASVLEYLVKVGGLDAEEFLRFYYYDMKDKKLKRAIIKALAQGKAEASKNFLWDILNDKRVHAHLRMEAASSLISYPETNKLIIDLLVEEEDELMVDNFIESLSKQGVKENKDFLKEILNDQDIAEELKVLSIGSIEINDYENYDYVMEVIQGEHADDVRIEAIDKLSEIDEDEIDLDYSSELTKLLENEESDEVRETIYDALDLHDNFDFDAIQAQVINEENPVVFMTGVIPMIHDRKLNGIPLDTIDPIIVARIRELAKDPKNERASKYVKYFE